MRRCRGSCRDRLACREGDRHTAEANAADIEMAGGPGSGSCREAAARRANTEGKSGSRPQCWDLQVLQG